MGSALGGTFMLGTATRCRGPDLMASCGGRGGIRGEDAAAEAPRAPRDHAVPNRAEDRGRAVHGRAARRRGGGGGAAVRILDNNGDRAMAPAKRTGRLFRRILRPKTEQIRAGHLDGRGRPKHPVSGNEPFRVMAWAWRWPLAGSPRDSPPSVAQGRLGAGRGRGAFARRATSPRRQGPAARCRTAIGSKGTSLVAAGAPARSTIGGIRRGRLAGAFSGRRGRVRKFR